MKKKRLEDILNLGDWLKNPFTADTEEAGTSCQELLELRYDEVNIISIRVDVKTYG